MTHLDNTVKNLELKIQFIQQDIQKLVREAVALKRKGNTKLALSRLKRKRHKEAMQQRLLNAMETLSFMKDVLDEHTTLAVVSNALREGNDAITAINQEVNIDTVTEIVDKCQEHLDNAEDVFGIISEAGQQAYDEDELLAELDAMQAQPEETDDDFQLYLPPAPTQKPTRKPQKMLLANTNK